jgi:hypothetical protein
MDIPSRDHSSAAAQRSTAAAPQQHHSSTTAAAPQQHHSSTSTVRGNFAQRQVFFCCYACRHVFVFEDRAAEDEDCAEEEDGRPAAHSTC